MPTGLDFLDEQNIMRFVFLFTIYTIDVCHTLTAAGMPEPAQAVICRLYYRGVLTVFSFSCKHNVSSVTCLYFVFRIYGIHV